MNRPRKALLLILAMFCVFSLCIFNVGADETDTQNIDRQPAQLLIITYNNCRTEYTEGEYFDATGIIGYVSCYNPQDSFYIESSELTYLETFPLTTDITHITFTYENLICTLPITVTASDKPYVQAVGLEVTAIKSEFLALEKIDPSSFLIEVINDDGSRTAIDATACNFSPSLDEPISSYTNNISVTYSVNGAEFTDTVDISVAPIILVTMDGLENVKFYNGMAPSLPENLIVTAYYDEALTLSQVLTDYKTEYAYDIVKPDENGKAKVTFIFDSQRIETEFPVVSIVNYVFTGFESAYYYGDNFSYSTVRVSAVYEDGMSRDITNEVLYNAPSVITAHSKITASHEGKDITPYLGFTLPTGKLIILEAPVKLHYEVGEKFDATGLTVLVEYSDGVRHVLVAGDYSISAPEKLTDDIDIGISYLGITENISITVGNKVYITALYLLGTPDVMSYYEGHFLNISGIVLEAYYSDGTMARIDPRDLTFTPSLNTPLTMDITSVKISANDGTNRYCEVSYPITVTDKHPTSLVPNALPNKLQYNEGEKFNPDGLELRLYFNDGSYIVPSTYNFSPELGSTIILRSNNTETYIVRTTYEYEGVTYSYPIEITVTPAQIESLFITRNPAKTVYEIGETFDPTGVQLIIIYSDVSVPMSIIPADYYTYSPSIITETTTEIVFSFRGHSVSLPIKVNVPERSDTTTEPTPPETTAPITPPETTEGVVTDEVTTQPIDETDDTNDLTDAPETTLDPETTVEPDISTSPNDVTTNEGEDTNPNTGDDKKEPSSLLYLWIVVIVIIVAALIALIIYYKKNFT